MRVPVRPRLERAAHQARGGAFGLAREAVEGPELVEEGRAARRRHQVAQDQPVLEVGVAARTVADLEVRLLGGHVAQRDRHLQRQLDVGKAAAKELELGHHELAAERGRHRHPQSARAGRGALARHLLQRGERGAHMLQIGCALAGEGEITATEQADAEVRFELADAMADRAHGHAQLRRGAAGAAQARDRLEGEQALDRGDAAGRHLGMTPGGRADNRKGGREDRIMRANARPPKCATPPKHPTAPSRFARKPTPTTVPRRPPAPSPSMEA